MSTFQKDDGTGMVAPANGEAAGAVTSREATRKNPRQGLIVDRNKHGIRRERNLNQPPRKTRPKKV